MYRDSRHYHSMAVGAYLPGVTCLVLLSTLSQLHNLNLRIKTEPVMAGADTTQYICSAFTRRETKHILAPLPVLQP